MPGTIVRVIFNEPMNKSATEGAFSITPDVNGSFSWPDDTTLIFKPDASLDYSSDYSCTLSTDAKDLSGQKLDGNSNGIEDPADVDSYTWSFSTISGGGLVQRSELAYMTLHWFDKPDPRIELRTTEVDIELSNENPQLRSSYIVKATVANVGGTASSSLVRFYDGNTQIGSDSVYLTPDQSTTAEIIWTPLKAGPRFIKVAMDPEDTVEEIFEFNNQPIKNTDVYFFYDDMELGADKWEHDDTIVRINGESSLEYMHPPVQTDIVGIWNETESEGFHLNTEVNNENLDDVYHSAYSSYLMFEQQGQRHVPVDVVITLDNSGSMSGEWEDARDAAISFVNNLYPTDRCAVYQFTGSGSSGTDPIREIDFVRMGEENVFGSGLNGKEYVKDWIGDPSNYQAISNTYTPIWDTIWDAVDYAIANSPPDHVATVVPMTDGADTSSDVNNYRNDDNNEMPDGDSLGRDGLDDSNTNDDWADPYDPGNDGDGGICNVPIPVFTIGLGVNTNAENRLKEVGRTSNQGSYYYAPGGSELETIYQSISETIQDIAQVQTRAASRSATRAIVEHFADDFESGDFSGGPWNAQGGWSVENNGRGGGSNAEASGDLNDRTLTLDRNIDLYDSTNTQLTFYHYSYNTESADDMIVEASGDGGGTWSVVAQWDGDEIEYGSYHEENLDLSAYDGESDFRLRFRFTMSQSSEGWRIDDIRITGSAGGYASEDNPWSDGDLNNMRDKYLTTETFSLTGASAARLTFYHKYNLKLGANGGVVLVGTDSDGDGDFTYEYVQPTQPYPSNIQVDQWANKTDDVGVQMRWAWNGISGHGAFTWEYVQVNLDRFIGEDAVRIKFLYIYCGGGNGYGWAIDDVAVKVSRSDAQAVGPASADLWALSITDSFSGDHAWLNRDPVTGHLKGSLDNALTSELIDLTNAIRASLSVKLKFNINNGSGRPPDGFRLEVSSDNGITWRAINFGVRAAWGLSGTEHKSYTGIDLGDNWVDSNSLARVNCDLSGWGGAVIKLRFRVVTAADDNPYFGSDHYQDPDAFGGIFVDDVVVSGLSY